MKPVLIVFILFTSMIEGVFSQNIRIQGIVKDAKNKEALEFANLVLQTADSAFVAGVSSGSEGRFIFTAVAPGNYRLSVSNLGYAPQSFFLKEIKEDTDLADILLEDESIALGNVTVSASNLSSRIDKKLIYPSERQLKASTNGLDLLQQLMLPKLMVNPLFNEVSLPGGGELQYRINGVKVEIQDIVALLPADIIRIEFHDNPGLRYGNAEVVLDYIVRRPETGGNLGLNLSDGIYTAWGNNYINGRINHKKSEFSLNYGISHRDFYQMWRDNEERFAFADGSSLHRKEAGEPGHGEMYWQNLNTAYSFQNDNSMFHATFRYYIHNQPHFDYTGILYNVADPADAVRMTDQAVSETYRPALDLYYQRNLKNNQTLVINLVGTSNHTDNNRIYRESRDGILLTDVNNQVSGRKYSWIGEGIYEKKLGESRISAGLRHTQAYSDNTYLNGHRYTTKMNQGETFLYSEFKGKAAKLDYTIGAGLTRSYFGQAGDEDYDYYTFNPRLVLHYTLPGRSSVRLRTELNNSSPSLSNLSAVSQIVDSLQLQRGNPSLKPFVRSFSELTYEFQKGIFYTDLRGTYEYRPNAIMDEKYLEGDKIVQTWNNQKSWQRLSSRLTLRIGPVKDIFQLGLTGGMNHYLSHGNTYRHRYTNWFTYLEGSATYKGFMASLGLETAWNWFYGETMEGGENIHYAMLGYKYKELSFMLGMFNPFADNYKQETENRSQYASYKKTNYINESSRMLLLRFSYNFSFGRTYKAGERRLNNADEDAGVMSTGK
ncbi:MAG: carboxypeptidase regulatory-like domain-containing protein [Tannerellaceae bacterium]|jgi:hypothetical protein|nr:carboxypeptidase regulatory-like domain-containing protein [Tannerellaceae bacterium]